ncbi:reverse transcriptase domain-containing protein [Tanacetum coccineum]|uniref:Reverse transcriptase domain-containing protein n=1 Tax=Tanacetum coccineum TaxID=301880 RepID=A0ABQ4WGP1_9ASTR
MKIPNYQIRLLNLMLFLFSRRGTRIWLRKRPPLSIETWDDLVSNLLTKFFPPSKTTNLRNEITRFQQKFDETFYEAWDRFNDLLRGCPHHGFSELHQLDTFYNALNSIDQDSLNSAAGAKMSTSSSTPAVSSDVAELKDMVRALILDRKNQTPASAPVKAVEQSCSMCPRPLRPISTKLILVIDLRWSQIKFDLLVFLPFRILMQIVKTISIEEITSIKTEETISTKGQFIATVNQPVAHQPVAHQGPAPQTHGVSKTDFERYVTANDAVLRNMQNQGQNLQSQMANLTDMLSKFVTANTASTSGSGTLPGNTVTNPKEDLKGITTRSGVTIQGPKAVNHDAEVTKDTMPPANNGSTEDVQPPVVQIQSRNPNPEPNVTPVCAPVVPPIPKASIPFPSRRNDERRKEKANDQIEKFYEIFRDLSFEISFTDALMLMPKFASTLKTLIGNKEKLSELARTPLNENCSAVILNKLPKKLGDPGRFLIPCEFTGITTCNALADLVMRLIDVYEGEIPVRVGKEAITFNPYQTQDTQADYNHMTVNKTTGNPTPYFEPIVSTASPNLTPFGDSDFLLFEEADSFLALEDEPTSSEVDPTYQDPEGDILLLEAILNSEPPPPLPNQEQYLPGVRKELKLCEAKIVESSVDEPPEVELKELPPHLEYAFLEGDDKLPVIIAKDLKDEEKAALLKVLKSHKRAIAWKLSDIKGVSPE